MADDISEWIVVAVMAAMGLFVGFTIVAFAAGWMDSDNRCNDGWIWVKGEMKPRTVVIGKNTYVVADYPDAKCMEVLP